MKGWGELGNAHEALEERHCSSIDAPRTMEERGRLAGGSATAIIPLFRIPNDTQGSQMVPDTDDK